MEDHCRLHIRKYVLDNARVYVDDNVHVELTNRPEESNELACLVTFSSRDQDWRLLLHFEQVDINYNPGTVDRYMHKAVRRVFSSCTLSLIMLNSYKFTGFKCDQLYICIGERECGPVMILTDLVSQTSQTTLVRLP